MESDKDIEKAKVWLLKKAKKVAAKKGTRSAFEGGILAAAAPNAVLLEMNCETDFAAKETNFTSVLRDIAKTLQGRPSSDVEEILRLPHSSPTVGGVAVSDTHQAIETLTGILKENVKLRRALTVTPQPDVINFSYVHGSLDSSTPPIGRIGVLLSLKLTPFPEKIVKSLNTMANNFCVQIAVNSPQALYPDPSQTFSKGEDQETEPIFVEQEYLFDSSVTVGKEIQKFQKRMGYNVELVGFQRWELAEGIERTEANLANDVQALLKESSKQS
uniref:Elongation factor Ts, mitochondrial n=1 Tax=Arcella intermedia TaxID=1963864 RepID=A0A6B2LCJ7_9EUKA